MLLSDANLQMNGKYALLSILLTHYGLAYDLWFRTNEQGLVSDSFKYQDRKEDWQRVYYF